MKSGDLVWIEGWPSNVGMFLGWADDEYARILCDNQITEVHIDFFVKVRS